MKKDSINIIIVDDHQLFIDGIVALFKKDDYIQIIDKANSEKELFIKLVKNKFDVLLLDLNLGEDDGLLMIHKILSIDKNIKIIVLTTYDLPKLVSKTFKNGAHGFVLKNTSKQELIEAIDSVCGGKSFISPSLVKRDIVVEKERRDEYPDKFITKHKLTTREFDVMILLSKSFSSKEIAHQLFISELTVATYRKSINKKMGFKNITHLVRFVFENNLK